ncbi:heme ABC transporter permease/ATP-binding protein CydD [Entomomonas asaccharolytica]|uniref:Cysteine/glutathione ABC transporter permease/ATP-binding protein CydD n=1 Tax=Entomomonas asaccharolytica TaxID=2785331 RepID=A0A974RXT8_9GAMM|nr:cysteine/glutathione ABC transporter permease/ATP-binding protein CydD [Entomomonas asaccharolytica]QQP86482.1 cysteine/glutathione ABC transporter permease/ATP-binding protein CydD [Entomomonas asaccharolytica]
MNKTKQKQLIGWLKQQNSTAKKWLRILIMLGTINGLVIIIQAWLLATILHNLIVDQVNKESLSLYFLGLIATTVIRTILAWSREKVGFLCGAAVRKTIRKTVLDKLEALGPVWIQNKPAGSWATMILEQIEEMQDFYSRYLPQVALAAIIPIFILIAVYPTNWAAGLILTFTAPLIPLFMALVGMGAAEANQRNFAVLARLSGTFLDRLKGLNTLRLFFQGNNEIKQIEESSEDFRQRTMSVLKQAFLSSAVLEFFASVSIAIVAVYFGFSYLGELNFGHYGLGITLFAGFFALILAPEFFQPLRDLGTFYHAKAQAIGAAESLVTFLAHENNNPLLGDKIINSTDEITIIANELFILSPQGQQLAGPLSFTINSKQKIAIVGHSGAGKSSLFNLLLGFLPYRGSLTINGIELNQLDIEHWRQQLSWVGQNPYLPETTIKQNILLANPNASEQQLTTAIKKAYVDEFLERLPNGIETSVGEYATRLSIGQTQRIAVARALLMPCRLLLLDEPTASLDVTSEMLVMQSLTEAAHYQATIMITHQLKDTANYDTIWVMDKGLIIQTGNYHELSQVDGAFAQLLASQREEI